MDDVLDKARRAKERASQLATGLKEGISDKVDDARDRIASGAADLRDASMSRIREAIEGLNATLPAIREAGYTLTDVSVSISVPPTIVAAFRASDTVTEESAQRIIEQHADSKLTVFLLRALVQAWKLQSSIELAGLKSRAIAVELGLPPAVSIKFS